MRVGSLFTGYGGLDLAVGGDLQWVVEWDKAPSKVLAHNHPGVTNYGDVTAVDWQSLPPVDVLTGGYPCQPFSHAGTRQGTDDPRHLWPHVFNGLRHLHPRLGLFENVAGHRSLGLANVLADLASIGWDAQWVTVRASDAGAPHGRERVFIAAWDSKGPDGGVGGLLEVAAHVGQRQAQLQQPRGATAGGSASAAHPGGSDVQDRQRECEGPADPVVGSGAASTWGPYLPALERWAHILGRGWPHPTVVSARTGGKRLSPAFTEWLMGLPEGWTTSVPGVSDSDLLKMHGNGVCPQQAELAILRLAAAARAL